MPQAEASWYDKENKFSNKKQRGTTIMSKQDTRIVNRTCHIIKEVNMARSKRGVISKAKHKKVLKKLRQ